MEFAVYSRFDEILREYGTERAAEYRGAFAFEIKGLPFEKRVRQAMRYLGTL